MEDNIENMLKERTTGWTQRKADGIIAAISMAWGTSYLLMKMGLEGISPFNMVALRFGIASLVTALIFNQKIRKTNKNTLAYGAVLGFILFAVFSFIMYGLQTTTASTAGFLTSTTVVFVPILQLIITRKKPQWQIVIGTILTITGITLLTVQESLEFNVGAVFCVVGALLYAFHIILTDRFTHRADGLLLGIYQLGFAGIFGLIASLIFEKPTLPSNTAQWVAVLGLALVCGAFGFVMQPIAQKYTTPEHTGLLFGLEPVFSAIFASVFLHEILTVKGYIGAGLVLFSVFLSAGRTGQGTAKRVSGDNSQERDELQ